MTRALLLFLIAAFFVTGCGGKTYYVSADKSRNETEKDHMTCEYEAEKATAGVVDNAERQERISSLVDKCMRLKGYQPE
jgi:hypothetical protein